MRMAAADLGAAPLAVPEALCPLIDALGTPRFAHLLFASVQRALGAGAAAVYAAAGAGEARLVAGEWEGGGALLERHTSEYAGCYAGADPARQAFRELILAPGRRACLTTAVARTELAEPGHRRLLEEAGFADRVATLFPAGAQGWFSLHVLRRPGDGALSDRALEGFARAAPVLGALIERHLRATASLEARLHERCPGLTAREAAVCAALLRGRSSSEIAEALGIEASSVKTYRKRAYAKLGLHTLPELFLALLDDASHRDPERDR